LRVKVYRELNGTMKWYELNPELNESEIYSFKLSSEGDGHYGHYTRMIELEIAREYTNPKEFGSKKVTLTTREMEETESLESFLEKKEPILIIRESGMKNTKFPKEIKFAGSSNVKELKVESIWLSSEGFDEILFGMKLPDATGKLKMTTSAFLRAFERMTS
jgi:hypothetical protein